MTYRQAEVSAIVRCLRAGDSCSVVGVSGMAKSNLFRHLIRDDVRRHFLGDELKRFIFLPCDANALGQVTEHTAHEMLLDALASERHVLGESAARLEEVCRHAASSPDVSARKRGVMDAVRALMAQDGERHLVFLFDQFDDLYKTLPPHFFANLRALRDQYKYRVSYVLFTRDELPRLCRAPKCEEFYELVSPNVIGLGPYGRDDATLLLARVGGRYNQTLPGPTCDRLIELSGGHPGILKAICIALLHGKVALPPRDEEAIAALLSVDDVETECEKLWGSIGDDERQALRAVVLSGVAAEQDAKAIRRLTLKHLLSDRHGRLTSPYPVFTKYVADVEASRQAATKIQAGPIRMDMAGEVWVNGRVINPPLTKKEALLLEYFCLEPGRLSSRDEIIAVIYPDAYRAGEPVSDDALNALVRRLRDRIEPHSQGRFRIATVRGKGYRLEISHTA